MSCQVQQTQRTDGWHTQKHNASATPTYSLTAEVRKHSFDKKTSNEMLLLSTWKLNVKTKYRIPVSIRTAFHTISSEYESADVNFLYDDIVHVLQNTIDSRINYVTDRRSSSQDIAGLSQCLLYRENTMNSGSRFGVVDWHSRAYPLRPWT